MPSLGKRIYAMGCRSGAALLGLALLMGGACAKPGDRSELPDRPYAESSSSELYRESYRYIRDRYVRSVTVRDIALAGLKGLSSLDNQIAVAPLGSAVTVSHAGRRVATLPAPQPQDHDGWADTTAAAIRSARSASEDLRKAGGERVQQAVMSSALTSLDTFSRYVAPSDAREGRALRSGYGGIGITVQLVQEQLKVISVMPGTPAEVAGLRADDAIVRIGGKATAGQELRQIVQQLRGPEGSRVILTVSRSANPGTLDLTVIRRHIIPVAAVYRRDGNLAHIQVTRFLQGTARQVARAVTQARREMGSGLGGIILDLRDDPGGLLDQAIAVADLFLQQGRIVSTIGRHPESQQSYEARPGDIAAGLPIVVLVNGRTASSSEIVASALQDNGRAVIVGSNSYGKGTVQTVFTLPNDGELVLTWSRFHAPSGYALEGLGVLPNVCTAKKQTNPASVVRTLSNSDSKTALVFRQWRTIDSPSPNRAKPLRIHCASEPAEAGRNAVDMDVAKVLLGDPGLYQRALAISLGPQAAFRQPQERDLADPDEQ
jgi:carboxyl-terminal processing protease